MRDDDRRLVRLPAGLARRLRVVGLPTIVILAVAGVFGLGLATGLVVEPGQVDRLSRFQHRLLRKTRTWIKPAPAAAVPWPTHASDLHSTRYSPAAQITRSNVGALQVAWIHPTGESSGRQRTTPVVVDSTLYYTAGVTTAIAIDAKTGRERWRHREGAKQMPPSCCGLASRGLAVDAARVYLATIDARLVALNRANGEPLWQVQIAVDSGHSVTMAPLVVEELVIVGASGSEFGVRGFLDAYDARTGSRRWRFWTIPAPDEGGWWGPWSMATPDGDSLGRDIAGEKRDSARYAESWRRGGGAVWITPSYDPSLRTLYFGTGNAAPMYNARVRPGDNLYTSSILAVDIDRGTRKWHYQIVPHDAADRDMAAPVVLFDRLEGDSVVPALAQANKTGMVYVLDRRTGRRLLRSEPVVPQHNAFKSSTPEGRLVYPGPEGGLQAAPPAFSHRTGLLYVLMRHAPKVIRETQDTFVSGKWYMGGTVSRPPGEKEDPWNAVAAVDLSGGKVRWRRREVVPVAKTGGLLVTAGDLLFYGVGNDLRALDGETGRTLWRFRCDGPVTSPPISYAVGGRQYIAVATNTTLFAFALPET